jgi:Tfp pilus assembly protein PilE
MSSNNQDFSVKERLMVVAILFLLAVIAIQNFVLAVKTSEEETVKTAAVQYAGVRNMYTAQNHADSVAGYGVRYGGASGTSTSSIH